MRIVGVVKAAGLGAGLLFLSSCASAPPQKSSVPSKPAIASPQAQPAKTPPAPAGHAGKALYACKMTVSNAPAPGADGQVASAAARVKVEGVTLMLAPVSAGCLSSGFGPRGNKPHKGVDYFARGGDVLAAGGGVIKEALTRADFGNMILIDHGGGVFTRYAHLASFARPFAVGDKVKAGARLGPIGASGAAGAPHLHYEILSGAYVGGVGSFGLKHHDPFALPRAD